MDPLTIIAITYWIKWITLTLGITVVIMMTIWLGRAYQCQLIGHVPEEVEYMVQGHGERLAVTGIRCSRCKDSIHMPMFTERYSDPPSD